MSAIARGGGEALAFEDAELEGTVFARFERVAARFPARDAVRGAGGATSYRDLREAAAALAAALAERLGGESGPLALVADPGAPLFSAMLGALAAGRLYAPVDPKLPDARIEAILGELDPCAVVAGDAASAARAEGLCRGGPPIWTIGELVERRAGSVPRPDPLPPAGGNGGPSGGDDAYVLFTSGSTSRPKGVVQSHRNVLHNVARLTRGVGIVPGDRITLLSSPSFGASVSDIFGALLNGAAVCPWSLAGDGVRRLPAWLEAEAITIFHSVPSVFRSLAWTLGGGEDLSRVRLIKLGGEAVLATDFEIFRNRFRRGTVFHVGYGATEINVMRQWFAGHDTAWPGASPLGHPVDGVEVVLLSDGGGGGEGEIGIVSDTLATRYWRDPEKTAETFRPVPGRPEARLYRTGDLGRLLPDGCLLHLGRRDERLKVRGHRVEAAEVEGEILALPGVREAAVGARAIEGGVRLVAWVAGTDAAPPDAAGLRRALAARLAPAMVPAHVVVLPALPRTPGGKVDRAALPDPESAPRDADAGEDAPDAVRAVMRAFRRVLGADAGRDDDFFELGGDSLSAVELLVEIGRELGTEPSVADLLESATPAALAARCAAEASHSAAGVVRLSGGGSAPASGSPAVFVVPGGGGDGEDLFVARRLARLAGPDRAFYALRSGPPPHPDVDALAARFVERIRAEQPAGPYALVGDCVGGVLAFALASRLREDGDEVEALVLLDAPFPGAARRARGRMLRHASWLEAVRRRAVYFAARLRHHLGVARGMPGGGLGYLWRQARVAGRGLAPRSSAREREARARRESWVATLMAWTPLRYAGAVRLIESEDGGRRGFARAWGEVAPDAEVVRVAGAHTGLILDHGDEVAALLRRWLSRDRKTET